MARSLRKNWRPHGALTISAISSANIPEFTLLSPAKTPSSGSKQARVQSITALNNNNNNNNNNLLIYSAPFSMEMIKGALHIQY